MTIEDNRRNVLKGAAGALAVGATGLGTAHASEHEEEEEEEEVVEDWNEEPLANCWMHGGGTTPFRGAHGHRHWSPWSLQRRAEGLNEVGFNAIGLFHDDIQYRIDHEFTEGNRRGRLQQLNSVLQRNGIEFVEVEFLVEWLLDEDDPRREAEEETRQLLLNAAEALDANHIKIGNINGYPRDVEDLKEKFEEISAEFAEVDTEVGLEFFPVDPNIDTIGDALEITEDAENGGLYLDLWHNMKMDGVTFEDIEELLDADDVVAVEFQDGYIDTDMDFLQETINLRKIPGEGEFPIADWIDAVRATGFDGPWGLEILSEEFRRFSMDDAYNRAFDAGMEYLQEENQQ